MVFSSIGFLFIFLPIVLFLYFILPTKYKNIFLLVVSLIFYSTAKPIYLVLLLITILANYKIALKIEQFTLDTTQRKKYLYVGVFINLLILGYFKYFNFFIENINYIFQADLPLFKILLPIGISFYIFQSLSYIIDVYRKKVTANNSITEVALYIAMFPQLVAGPIIKYVDIKDQIKQRTITADSFSLGIERFIIGLGKKVLIADTVGETAEQIFIAANVTGIESTTALLGALCYTLQIYFDFSGYSSMAIGLGLMFGFRYNENFNYPYISTSITEFWRRWHISLSSWFKEYLYIPLGGSKKNNTYRNLFIVFCATGIWHGAAWTFLIWGLWHGLFIILEKMLTKKTIYQKIPLALRWLVTMFVVVIGWIIFKSENLTAATTYLSYLFGLIKITSPFYTFDYFFNKRLMLTLPLAIFFASPILDNICKKYKENIFFTLVKYFLIILILIICMIYIVNAGFSPFIYFQF